VSSRPTAIKKTVQTTLGDVVAQKGHALGLSGGGFRASALLQELACYLGQMEVFDKASEVLGTTTGASLSDKQIERICHYYGQRLGDQQAARIASGAACTGIKKGERYYGMLDGGMVQTREGGWKEMKLARIMDEQSVLQLSDDRGWIRSSTYVAHLGGHQDFLRKVEWHTDEVTELVILADGAPWIWKWAQELYPDSVQILDFYHAKEHLCRFAKLHFKEDDQRQVWIEAQTKLILEDKAAEVVTNVQSLANTGCKQAQKEAKNLVKYFQDNSKRMMYATFREKGLIIGSGPIESAHRNVIQKRMKRSGQRWTIKGAQQIANLRTARESNQWQEVADIIRKAA
jgi:hypothetical protein